MMPLEAVDRLTAVVRLQADIIDELFLLLMQHVSAEEADTLPVIDKINLAAKLRTESGEAQ